MDLVYRDRQSVGISLKGHLFLCGHRLGLLIVPSSIAVVSCFLSEEISNGVSTFLPPRPGFLPDPSGLDVFSTYSYSSFYLQVRLVKFLAVHNWLIRERRKRFKIVFTNNVCIRLNISNFIEIYFLNCSTFIHMELSKIRVKVKRFRFSSMEGNLRRICKVEN